MTLPLLDGYDPDDRLGVADDRTIGARAYLAMVAALAASLPPAGHMVNLCRDRLCFAVAFGAALQRGQVSLLPPNATPGMLSAVKTAYPDAYALVDGDVDEDILPAIRFAAGQADAVAEPPRFPGDQTAAILFTSGSTGSPQPFARSWGAMVASAKAAGDRLVVPGLRGSTVVATVPHQHSYGIESAVMLALQHGLALDSDRPLLPGDVCARLEATPRPRVLVTTPIHLKALLADAAPLPAVDLIVSATAPLSPQLASEAEARFVGPLYEIYGCSEAGQLATRRTALTETWECLAGVTLRQDAAGTHAGGSPVGREQRLSDVIELLSPTRFLLHGRAADLINIAGKRSSLAHLDFQLNAVPGVQDGAFLMPDEGRADARPMAFAVAPGLTTADILAALRRHVDPAFLPRPLVLVDSLPRNTLGKLPRDALLDLARRHRP